MRTMKTKQSVCAALAISLITPLGAFAEEVEQSISAREAREKTRLAGGGTLVRDKVEIFTKPGGGQFTVEEVTEILQSSGREYGVVWKEDIVPAADGVVEDLAAALGTTRKELEAVAKDVGEGGKDTIADAQYALGVAQKELKVVAGDAEYALDAGKKELKAVGEDVQYALKESSKDLNMVSQDLIRAGRQTQDDIKYALEVSAQGDGAVGMVASALGCTTEELVDVVQYFGKEAKAIFGELSELPEIRDMRDGLSGVVKDAEKVWVSNNGSLVAALGVGGSKVVIGQAPAKTKAGEKRVHWSVESEQVSGEDSDPKVGQ